MVWRPAKQEGDNHKHNHSHGSLPLKPPADTKQALDGYSIAGQHDGQGDKKTQSVAKNPGGQPPYVSLARIVLFFAQPLAGDWRKLGRIKKPWQRQKYSNSPDTDTNSPADRLSVSLACLHSSHDHHVAIHTNASQEEDAGVEAQLLEDGDNFAHGVSEHPSLCNGGGPERERDGQQEVRDCQVEEVEVGGSQRLLAEANHQTHYEISRNRQQKDEDVKDADNDRHCIWDLEGAAGLRVRVDNEVRVIVIIRQV